MNSLRILLVEGDEPRADRLLSLLASFGHSTIPVPDLNEASEALFIQRFDAVLLGSGQSAEDSAAFLAKLRSLETGQRFDSRAAVLGCSPSLAALAFLDGSLPDVFDAETLAVAVSRLQAVGQGNAASTASGLTPALPVFEPDQFEEQCANETDLMIEIIDLFAAERERELPAMTEALAEGDFERLSRMAHTVKGSLGALHAPLARQRAQTLEMAAIEQNKGLCAESLQALDDDLAELNGRLVSFREACLGR